MKSDIFVNLLKMSYHPVDHVHCIWFRKAMKENVNICRFVGVAWWSWFKEFTLLRTRDHKILDFIKSSKDLLFGADKIRNAFENAIKTILANEIQVKK